MLTRKNKKAFNYFNVLAIFSAFFLLGFLAIPFCSPIIATNAVSPNSPIYNLESDPDTQIKLSVTALPLLAVSVSNIVDLTVNNAGGFVSGDLNIAVNTNNAWGYTLQVEDKDNVSALVSDDSSTQITSDFEGGKTSAQMSDNTWGYALADTEYETFNSMPLLNNPATIRTTSTKSAESSSVTTFKIGIKAGSDMDPGVYADVIMFTAFVNAADACIGEGFYCISTMQEMTEEVCEETPTPSPFATEFTHTFEDTDSKVPRTILTDTRDNKTYIVSKLADGHCWMSQNLDLDLSSSVALTNENTDLNTKESWTPSHSTDTDLARWADGYTGRGFYDYDDYYGGDLDVAAIQERSYRPVAAKSYMQNGTTPSSTPSSEDPYQAWEKVGVFYNWFAATAGDGVRTIKSLVTAYYDNSYVKYKRSTLNSICPKGWRLPDGWTFTEAYYAQATYDDYNNLNIYGVNEDILKAYQDPINLIYSGYVNSHYNEDATISFDQSGTAGIYTTNSLFSAGDPSNTFAFISSTWNYNQSLLAYGSAYNGGNQFLYEDHGILRSLIDSITGDRGEGKYSSHDSWKILSGSTDEEKTLSTPTTFHGFSVRCIAR